MLGAMLCAPCKAALKRARYVTVQEDIRRPSVIDVRRQARHTGAAVPARAPAADNLPPVPAPAEAAANAQLARRIFVGILVLAAVLSGASYFGLRELGAQSHDASTSAVSSSPRLTPEISPSTLPLSAPPSAAAPVASPPRQVDPEVPGSAANPTPILPLTKVAAANAAKRQAMKNDASFSTSNGEPPDAVPMPEPEKPQPAPAPPPPAAPDRWQNMRDAIAQCDRQGVFDGIICGQKARIEYCEGFWGRVPQCPGPTANPEH